MTPLYGFLLFLTHVAVAITSMPELSTKFTLLGDGPTKNGIPHVRVKFLDGYVDTLVLTRFSSSKYDTCNFFGHLDMETDASVTMTGCVGSEDVELTILSSHAGPNTMWVWTREGNVIDLPNKVKVSVHKKSKVMPMPSA